MLGAELTNHLGYAPGQPKLSRPTSPIIVMGPHLRQGLPTIERFRWIFPAIGRHLAPQLLPKRVWQLPGFDQKVLSLYTRGLTVREMQGQFEELYQMAIASAVILDCNDYARCKVWSRTRRCTWSSGCPRWRQGRPGRLKSRGVEETSSLRSSTGWRGFRTRSLRCSPSPDPSLHGALSPRQPELRQLSRSQGSGGDAAGDLAGPDRSRGRDQPGRPRRWAPGRHATATIPALWRRHW